MKFSRPYFNREAYESGGHCGSIECQCGKARATSEYCETAGGSPGPLELWVPLCLECSKTTKIPNWRDATDAYLRTIIDFDSIGKKAEVDRA